MINLAQEEDGTQLQRQDNYVTCHWENHQLQCSMEQSNWAI